MSTWISQEERKEFEAWKDSYRRAAAQASEELIVKLVRFQLHSKDTAMKEAAKKGIDALEKVHLALSGREEPIVEPETF